MLGDTFEVTRATARHLTSVRDLDKRQPTTDTPDSSTQRTKTGGNEAQRHIGGLNERKVGLTTCIFESQVRGLAAQKLPLSVPLTRHHLKSGLDSSAAACGIGWRVPCRARSIS